MTSPSNASTDAYLSTTLCGAVQNGQVTGSTPITNTTSSSENLLSDPLNSSLLSDPYTYGTSTYNPLAPATLDIEDAEMAGLNQSQTSSTDDSSSTSDVSDPNDQNTLPSPMQIMSQGS